MQPGVKPSTALVCVCERGLHLYVSVCVGMCVRRRVFAAGKLFQI